MKKYLKLAYILLTLMMSVSTLSLVFYTEGSSEAFDWFFRYVGYPSLAALISMVIFGGYKKADEVIDNWLNK